MPRSLLSELKRRNVWRAAALYAAAAWLLVQVATQVFPFFAVPDWVVRAIVVVAAMGFPFWLAFAWLYEFTPEGIKREREVDPAESITPRTGKRLDRWIIGTLSVAVVLLLANAFVWHRGGSLLGQGEAEAADARSVAVLPFENLSSDREQGYFADGISEDLLDLLTKIPALRVAARTSSFAFKGRDVPVDSIARVLRVANVLQGSVQRAGDEVRISVQLVHAADGYVVWSDRWDRKLETVFAIQDEIARDVAAQLQVRLGGAAAPRARSTHPQAYALFLQARELGRQRRREAILRSDSLCRQVLATDPRYAPAWAQLARNFANLTSMGILPNEEGLRAAREAAGKALAIDSSYAPAHAELGHIAALQRDDAGAARELERALALDPTDPDVLGLSAVLLFHLGRLKQGLAVQEYVVARDPVNVSVLYRNGSDYIRSGRYDDAIVRFRTVLNLSPGFESAHFQACEALLLKGDAPAAFAEIQQESSEAWRLIGLPLAYHALGRRAESDSALAALIAKYTKDAPYNIAYVYAYRGEADRAFAWLDRAVEYGDPGLSEIAAERLFDRIRADPRWLPFLRRIGRAPEQLARIPFHVTLPSGTVAGATAGMPAVPQPAALAGTP